MSSWMRSVMLVLDGIALVGLVIFSVAGALNRDNTVYLAGQIVCAVWVLCTVYVLHYMNGRDAGDQTGEGQTDD